MAQSPISDLAGEIAYVKSLAQEGRNAPLIGGILYVIWGTVIAVAALSTYFVEIGVLNAPFVGGAWFWFLAFVVGWASSFILAPKAGFKPGAATIGNRTAGAAWLAVGVFMSIFWTASSLFNARFRSIGVDPHLVFGLMFPIAFGVYGIAFYATAVAARLNWMRGFAVSSWIFSIASLYFVGDARQLIIGVAGSALCAILPGVLLMRKEPNDIV